MKKKIKKQRFGSLTLMIVPGDQSRVYSLKIPFLALIFGFILLCLLIGNTFYLLYQRDGKGNQFQDLVTGTGKMEQLLDASIDLLTGTEGFNTAVNRLIDTNENVIVPLQDSESSDSFGYTHIEDNISRLTDRVNLAASVLQVTGEKYKSVEKILEQLPARWPLANGIGYVTQRYGYNSNPFNGLPYLHKGLDFGYGYGAPLVAVGAGVIEERGYDAYDYGNYVVIRHSFGYKTKYAHMQKVFVREGSTVKPGDLIGTMGATGKVTGPHLHLETYLDDLLIDPEVFIEISDKPRRF